MNRFFNPLRQFNYKYVVGELLLIFIGISLSMYFDEWRTNRTERKKEKELLIQLVQAVQRDTSQITRLIERNDQFARQMTYLIDTARFENQPTKKTMQYLSRLNYIDSFVPDLSAYENIKQEGFAIISTPSLKIGMIRYYTEVAELKYFIDWQRDNHFIDFKSYKIDAFAVYTFGVEAMPEDYGKLKADKRFWKLLRESRRIYKTSSEIANGRKTIAIEFLNQVQAVN